MSINKVKLWVAYIGYDVDKGMSNSVGQHIWGCLVEAVGNGLDTIAVTEETNVAQQIHWHLWVWQLTVVVQDTCFLLQ